jgi:hypothetical protein
MGSHVARMWETKAAWGIMNWNLLGKSEGGRQMATASVV